ncbi:hypothetical protein BDV93DRAFT_517585 [Ceratobasidium sp. AG-I]|nr:hypothetical protein BDV93DRAFT_517585 [Ceratobasidium sp. AG-I]
MRTARSGCCCCCACIIFFTLIIGAELPLALTLPPLTLLSNTSPSSSPWPVYISAGLTLNLIHSSRT